MEKRNLYRFSIKLDEEDAEHQVVGDYLNTLGRKKAKIIVKAVLAYLEIEKSSKVMNSRVEALEEKQAESQEEKTQKEKTQKEKPGRMIQIDMDSYGMDEAEIALMRRNYDKLGKE